MSRFHAASAWLAIALILFAIPSLPRMVPAAHAVVVPVATPWRPYGPYVREVLVTVFTNEIAELNAFRAGQLDFFDWTPPPSQIPILSVEPDALVSQPLVEGSLFQVDLNSRYPLLGVQQQEPAGPCSTDPSDPNYVGLFGGCSTMRFTPAGIQVRKAIAHLIDKAGLVNTTPLCLGGRCIAIDDPIGATCLENTVPCTTLATRVGWEAGTSHSGNAACLTSATPCAYKVAPGTGDGHPSGYCTPTPSCWGGTRPPAGTDMHAAWEHFQLAGLQDSDGDGLLDFPSTGQTIFVIRTDDTRRRDLGNAMADALDSLFERGSGGEPVIQRLRGSIADFGDRIFVSVPDADWGLYTGGWSSGVGNPISGGGGGHFAVYDSFFASDFCGGTQSLFNLNYGFYCNNAFDVKVERGVFRAFTLAEYFSPLQEALDHAGNTVMTIPVYTRASRTLHHNGWDGVVDVKSDGFANTFTWFNARAKPGYTGQFGGVGGNPDPEVYRAGFRQGTFRLNIFHAGTLWEAHVIFNILDGLMAANPRAAIGGFVDQFETGATAVTQAFNTLGADQVVSGDDEPVTVIDIKMRDDLFFHDGVNLTFDDFIKTGLAYKDVPQGGFGGYAAWVPLLAYSDPIPGSNCSPYCGRVVFQGQTFLHKLNIVGSAILPIHLWDSNGDGFVCGSLGIGSCTGLPADPTTDVNYDPMANGVMVGHGPWSCLDTVTGTPGGSCSETAAGVQGGQSILAGGRFIFTRYDGYYLGVPTIAGSPICNFATADQDNNWRIDGNDLTLALATGDPTDEVLVQDMFDFLLGGTAGKSLNEVDTTNTGNECPNPIA